MTSHSVPLTIHVVVSSDNPPPSSDNPTFHRKRYRCHCSSHSGLHYPMSQTAPLKSTLDHEPFASNSGVKKTRLVTGKVASKSDTMKSKLSRTENSIGFRPESEFSKFECSLVTASWNGLRPDESLLVVPSLWTEMERCLHTCVECRWWANFFQEFKRWAGNCLPCLLSLLTCRAPECCKRGL
jgi:hypothetical protein